MRLKLAWAVALLVVVLAVLVWAPGAGAQVMKHSGLVAAVDRAAGTIVLDEVGPWQVKEGKTVVTRRTLTVTPETGFVQARREATEWFPAEFTDLPLLREVAAGDFVTVECRHEGRRLVALRVTVVEPEAP